MDLQNQAAKIIELISLRLDPLFLSHTINMKSRESAPSIFAEYVRYEKAGIEFEVCVCLHPHDYPHSVSFRLIDKRQSPYKYIQQQELMSIANKKCGVKNDSLYIATDDQTKNTIEVLYIITSCILKEFVKN